MASVLSVMSRMELPVRERESSVSRMPAWGVRVMLACPERERLARWMEEVMVRTPEVRVMAGAEDVPPSV